MANVGPLIVPTTKAQFRARSVAIRALRSSARVRGRVGIAIAPSKPDVVYAFIDNWNSDPDTIYDDEYAPSGTLTPWRFMFLNEAQFAEIDKTIATLSDKYLSREAAE